MLNNPQLDMNVSIFVQNHEGIFPMACNIKVPTQKGKNRINLLRISQISSDQVNDGHFVLIKNIEGFLARKSTNENRSQVYRKKFCPQCLCQFKDSDTDKYRNHEKLCTNKYNQEEIMPDKTDRVEFSNYDKQYQTEVWQVISICITVVMILFIYHLLPPGGLTFFTEMVNMHFTFS